MISLKKPCKKATKRKRSYKQRHSIETVNGLYIKWRVAEKKKLLLEIAKSGGKRPRRKAPDVEERQLEHALRTYTRKTSESYDFSFDT